SASFLASLVVMLFALNGSVHSAAAQQPVGAASPSTAKAVTSTAAHVAAPASASEARVAPVIDGSDADAVWSSSTAITDFRVFDPQEDGEPHFRPEARAS